MDNETFCKISFKKKTEAINEQIISLINSKDLSKGDILPSERYLSKAMGVSRGALREALRALEMVGIIETKTGSGSYIKASGPVKYSPELSTTLERDDNPLNLIIVRKTIEPLSAKLAALNGSDEDILKLKSFYANYDIHAGEKDINYEIDGNFHLHIAGMSQNKTLIEVMRVISDRMKSDNFWRFAKEKTTKSLHHLGTHIDEHNILVKAISEHNEKEAEMAMKQHLRSVEKGLLQFF